MADATPGNGAAARAVCVGSEREMGALAAALRDHLEVSVRPAPECTSDPDPNAVHILFNEFRHDLRDCARALVARDIATIYAIDGILEWRGSWEYPEGGSSLFAMRPVISHKVACIGRSQARLLAAWGNAGRCEIIGMPRLDALAAGDGAERRSSETVRVLVATANNPGFDAAQLNATVESLRDLDAWARSNPECRGRRLEWVWRLTRGLEEAVQPAGRISARELESIADLMRAADIVVTTPSTIQLEAMLLRRPVALLDYHNRPHYVPAAWVISCQRHLGEVMPELIDAPPTRLRYQDFILSDALECRSPSAPRLATLVRRMHAIVQQSRATGRRPEFPPGLAETRGDSRETAIDMASLFPEQAEFADRDLALLQAQLADCGARLRLERVRVEQLTRALERPAAPASAPAGFPGPRKLMRLFRNWRAQSRAPDPDHGGGAT